MPMILPWLDPDNLNPVTASHDSNACVCPDCGMDARFSTVFAFDPNEVTIRCLHHDVCLYIFCNREDGSVKRIMTLAEVRSAGKQSLDRFMACGPNVQTLNQLASFLEGMAGV